MTYEQWLDRLEKRFFVIVGDEIWSHRLGPNKENLKELFERNEDPEKLAENFAEALDEENDLFISDFLFNHNPYNF